VLIEPALRLRRAHFSAGQRHRLEYALEAERGLLIRLSPPPRRLGLRIRADFI
jgi:hypothetical protein